jgi:leucyl-tRNA synthetase
MTEQYNPQAIEKKWQAKWEADGLYRSKVDWSKPKHYALTMLPYPSGNLHMGHWYAMTPSDARARFMRMQGYNVLFPMGFDAFGLPAENAAVQRNIHPWKWTYSNIEHMRNQMKSMGNMFDWEREAVSCQPDYYKWTEWFFKRFYESGLAYRNEAMVNWSDALQTVLANEQVIDGKDERLGQPVIQKLMEQWFFRITNYADELLRFDGIDWPEPIKLMQTNWIGRSEGAFVTFKTEADDEIEIFTTRPDTLWGATFMVLSPEHPLVAKVTTAEHAGVIDAYKQAAAASNEIERMSEDRPKTGVFTGGYAINPVNSERIPIWIADYVLMTYGTGAIMAVPAHDQRDFEFARAFGLSIVPVIQPDSMAEPLVEAKMDAAIVESGVMINSGILNGIPVNTEKGRKNPAIATAIDYLEEHNIGKETVNYRMRDWLISRQRYWGSPIPMIYRADGQIEPVADQDLPVVLPEDVDFMPTGRSPLTYHDPFLRTVDSDGNPAQRETDTMDTFMCSSWYWYRYLSPQRDDAPFDEEEAAYWLPVDTYTGGAEHAVMHLLYARFFNKVMRDIGIFDAAAEVAVEHGRDPREMFDEPYKMLRNQGQILGEERKGDIVVALGERRDGKLFASSVAVVDAIPATVADNAVAGELMRRTENVLHVAQGDETIIVELLPDAVVSIAAIPGANTVYQLKQHLEIQRMSKSKGNVVDPDALVAEYGADVVRAYLMFAFDWEKGGPWNSRGISGTTRFLRDVWRIGTEDYAPKKVSEKASQAVRRKTHQTTDKVGREIAAFSFNTAIAALMELRNTLIDALKKGNVSVEAWQESADTLILLLAPIAPHITEELWSQRGRTESVHLQMWPEFDAEIAKEETIELVVQVNGKVRDKFEVSADISEEDAKTTALASATVQRFMDGKAVRKIIVIRGHLVNIVV